jgi:hypothetical protein
MQSELTFPHAQHATLQDAKKYLQSSLATFDRDPADSDYQRGFEAALRHLRTDLGWNLADDERPTYGSGALDPR